MEAAVGLRVYRINICERLSKRSVKLHDPAQKLNIQDVVNDFISTRGASTKESEKSRSWALRVISNKSPNPKGLINYGTFGYESEFFDNKTRASRFRRSVGDVEEIPLYFEFWLPSGSFHGFCAFQSFNGKSCIGIVLGALKDEYESINSDYVFSAQKLMPFKALTELYGDAPVKKISFVRATSHSDIADRYVDSASKTAYNIELSISAKRNGNLGRLGPMARRFPKRGDIALLDGIEFSEVYAQAEIGGKNRRIGVFGSSGNAGVIDLSLDVKRDPSGHPDFSSISDEAGKILRQFYKQLKDVRP